MSLAVGSAPTKTSSRHPTREHQHYLGTRYHPYQRPVSHNGSSTNHRETHSKQTTLSANDSCHYFQAKLDDPCVARPNDDTLEYAARMAAREAKAEECAVISPSLPSLINPITHLRYHNPGWATNDDTPGLLKASPLTFANCGPPIPSFALAAMIASSIDVGPHSSVQTAQSSPPSPPIQPTANINVQAIVERTDREILAQKLNEYLETHPEPVIGSIDNPFPFADKYGIKGISVLSAFFHHLDMDIFTCHFCHDTRTTIDDALDHQRVKCHYNE